jgi:putative two-component system response regulator
LTVIQAIYLLKDRGISPFTRKEYERFQYLRFPRTDRFKTRIAEPEIRKAGRQVDDGNLRQDISLEARDGYTRGHSERVSLILAGLVKRAGGTLYDIERARIAGLLHDIGKIGVRDSVLLKPGRLDYDEFVHIQQHPSIGASIIKAIPNFADILPVVLSHHERVDDKGYPQGLEGISIPLWARMTAVADTYDALTSDRPYRKSMSHDKALRIIKNASGTQLCSESVKLFFEWFGHEQPEIKAPMDSMPLFVR